MGVKQLKLATSAAVLVCLNAGTAFAAAGPVITGDKWAAYGIIGALILGVVAFVGVSVGVAQRDDARERAHPHHNVLPGLPVLGEDEDGDDD